MDLELSERRFVCEQTDRPRAPSDKNKPLVRIYWTAQRHKISIMYCLSSCSCVPQIVQRPPRVLMTTMAYFEILQCAKVAYRISVFGTKQGWKPKGNVVEVNVVRRITDGPTGTIDVICHGPHSCPQPLRSGSGYLTLKGTISLLQNMLRTSL